MRLAQFAAQTLDISRRAAKEAIRDGRILVDGRTVKKDIDVTGREALALVHDTPPVDRAAAEALLVSRTESTVFFDKPTGMHTERHRPDNPFVLEDAVRAAAPDYTLISRLDYGTDGILAAVKDPSADIITSKRYLALVSGSCPDSFVMDNRIDAAKRKTVRVLDEPGGRSVSFSVVERVSGASVVEARLASAGRHQLRALLAHAGCPIVGDVDYGGEPFPRLMLHSASVSVDGASCDSRLTDAFLALARAYSP